jgi:histidinol-phosphate aminotransferase
LQGLDFVGVPLTASFQLDVPAMCRGHHAAPTGADLPGLSQQSKCQFVARRRHGSGPLRAAGQHGGLVVIDEAYQPFAAKSYLDRMALHPHVLLLRTLSKFGLAGVRLGYLIGRQALIAQIDKVRPPYNVSVLNCEAALFALEHRAVFEVQAQDIRAQRAILLDSLSQLPGVQVFPSEANMILLRVPDAPHTFDALKARGVLIKNVSKMHPLLHNCLRLTVGTESENRLLLAALRVSL